MNAFVKLISGLSISEGIISELEDSQQKLSKLRITEKNKKDLTGGGGNET